MRGVSAPLIAVTTALARPLGPAATIGRYRLREVIGRGGSSVVYRAVTDPADGLPPVVAVKLAAHERCRDPEFRRQFNEHSRASAAIAHPSVLPVLDAGDDQGRPFLVLPHIAGADLSRRLAAHALTVGQVLALLRQVADGLDAMHLAGVLHLDVKPANVLVGTVSAGAVPAADSVAPARPVSVADSELPAPPGRPPPARAFLTDLGLCRFLADQPVRSGPPADFTGSPRYAAPEHLRGRAVRASSDVYSLACVLFACLAGRPPYLGEVPAVVTGHLSGRVPSLSALTALPQCLDRVIRRAMHPDPGSRYASCADLITGARLAILDGA